CSVSLSAVARHSSTAFSTAGEAASRACWNGQELVSPKASMTLSFSLPGRRERLCASAEIALTESHQAREAITGSVSSPSGAVGEFGAAQLSHSLIIA